jgi:8-amino-7-oxononanoate synthase
VGGVREQIDAELACLARGGLLRRLKLPAGIDFSSNDYLDLSRDARVTAAAADAIARHGAGAPSARLLRGNLPPHEEAERAAAEWMGAESALLLPSGWHANLALVGALAGRGDVVVCDERNHASLVDAVRLCGARVEVHAHHDAGHADALLRRSGGARRRFMVVESVESTGGGRAPLADLASVARAHDAWLLVDEAHAAGVFGPDGTGLACASGVADGVLARVVTGGKALGVAGAFVVGERRVTDLLLHRGRAFVFTTAVPPSTAAALAASIAIVRAEPGRRSRVHAAAARLRAALADGGLAVPGDGPIVPVVVGGADAAMRAAGALQARGFDVRALRPPTVPDGTSRLRIVCRAGHDDSTLDGLAAALLDVVPRRDAAGPGPTRPRALGVVGTDTGVGKTVVSAIACRALVRAGADVRYLKPVQTGTDSDTATVRRLARLDADRAPDPPFAFPLAASVDQAAEASGAALDAGRLAAAASHVLGSAPGATWIVEGAGGLLVPVNAREDLGDVLPLLVHDVVLVARSGLGTLNHTLLTVEALTRRRTRVRALVLVGEPHPANERTLRLRLDVPVLALPHIDVGDVDALDRWAESVRFSERIS